MRRRASNAPGRPAIYNRLWHLDADDRRHRGERKWEVDALDTFLTLTARLESLYPPDFSDRDQVLLNTTSRKVFAQIFTDRPTSMRLVLHLPARQEFTLRCADDLSSPAFARALRQAISSLNAQAG